MLKESDFVASVLPSTNDNTGFLNMESCFSKMKPSAVFMNIGRGTTVNEADLCQALIKKVITGEVLDVVA